MKSNYKKLGKYIHEVSEKNNEENIEKLLGVSISKKFIPSIANTIGTDMSKYKIVRTNQFAYGPVTSRNGDKISVALLQESDCIVSTSYTVFEIHKPDELLPEYLMMWFRRPEFDRYARFMSHGSVREIFGWEEMCDVELPVPDLDKQQQIVDEYNTIVNRIKLNEQLSKKLEETAQAIYKQWFVDFEFPITAEYAKSIGKPELEGKPYKSSGGEMVYNEELQRDVPCYWDNKYLNKVLDLKNGKTRPKRVGLYPVYGGNGILGYADSFNEENVIIIGRVGAYCGSLYSSVEKCWISDNAISAKSTETLNYYFFVLKNLKLNEMSEGTGQPLLTQSLLSEISLLEPDDKSKLLYEQIASSFMKYNLLQDKEMTLLTNLRSLLLSKMTKVGT
ncbi:MAG: restriction endonuclease subunit S [Gudongella sp.]|jgi:type I restriction enzyme S subunit|nr:restriction endonuclease subunit S [Gudongella sp.]